MAQFGLARGAGLKPVDQRPHPAGPVLQQCKGLFQHGSRVAENNAAIAVSTRPTGRAILLKLMKRIGKPLQVRQHWLREFKRVGLQFGGTRGDKRLQGQRKL